MLYFLQYKGVLKFFWPNTQHYFVTVAGKSAFYIIDWTMSMQSVKLSIIKGHHEVTFLAGLQMRSMNVWCKHWVTSACHTQLWRNSSVKIFRLKMQFKLRVFNGDHVHYLILAKIIAKSRDSQGISWVYNSWADGYVNAVSQESVKSFKCRSEYDIEWLHLPSWYCSIFSNLLIILWMTCHCCWNMAIPLWSKDQMTVHVQKNSRHNQQGRTWLFFFL